MSSPVKPKSPSIWKQVARQFTFGIAYKNDFKTYKGAKKAYQVFEDLKKGEARREAWNKEIKGNTSSMGNDIPDPVVHQAMQEPLKDSKVPMYLPPKPKKKNLNPQSVETPPVKPSPTPRHSISTNGRGAGG